MPFSRRTCRVSEKAPLYSVHEIYEAPRERRRGSAVTQNGWKVHWPVKKFGGRRIGRLGITGERGTVARIGEMVPPNYRGLAIVLQTLNLRFAKPRTGHYGTAYPTLSHNLYSGAMFSYHRKLRPKFRVKSDGGVRKFTSDDKHSRTCETHLISRRFIFKCGSYSGFGSLRILTRF